MRTVALSGLGPVDGFDISGDRLLVYHFERTTLLDSAVFDLTTGRRLWQHTDMAAAGGLWWCGTLLCTGSVGRTTVVDPDTGDARWSVSGWTDLGPAPPKCLATATLLACHRERVSVCGCCERQEGRGRRQRRSGPPLDHRMV